MTFSAATVSQSHAAVRYKALAIQNRHISSTKDGHLDNAVREVGKSSADSVSFLYIVVDFSCANDETTECLVSTSVRQTLFTRFKLCS